MNNRLSAALVCAILMLASIGVQQSYAAMMDPVTAGQSARRADGLFGGGPSICMNVSDPACLVGEDSSATGTQPKEVRGIFEFDISGITLSSTVRLDILRAPQYFIGSCLGFSGCPNIPSFNVYGYIPGADGIVAHSDFLMTPELFVQTELFGTFPLPAEGVITSVDISTFIALYAGAGFQFAGILLDSTGDGGSFFRASLDVSPSVVPIPAALSLMGSGLALLGLLGWRRKRAAAA